MSMQCMSHQNLVPSQLPFLLALTNQPTTVIRSLKGLERKQRQRPPTHIPDGAWRCSHFSNSASLQSAVDYIKQVIAIFIT